MFVSYCSRVFEGIVYSLVCPRKLVNVGCHIFQDVQRELRRLFRFWFFYVEYLKHHYGEPNENSSWPFLLQIILLQQRLLRIFAVSCPRLVAIISGRFNFCIFFSKFSVFLYHFIGSRFSGLIYFILYELELFVWIIFCFLNFFLNPVLYFTYFHFVQLNSFWHYTFPFVWRYFLWVFYFLVLVEVLVGLWFILINVTSPYTGDRYFEGKEIFGTGATSKKRRSLKYRIAIAQVLIYFPL